MERLENRTFDELRVGERVTITRALSPTRTSSVSPTPPARSTPTRRRRPGHDQRLQAVATGAGWAQAMVGAALATRFPGPGTVLTRHSFRRERSRRARRRDHARR